MNYNDTSPPHIPRKAKSAITRTLLFLVIGSLLSGIGYASQPRKITSDREKALKLRAIDAQEQMARYHNRLTQEIAKGNMNINAVTIPSKVGIRLNPSKATTSTIFFNDDMEGGINGWTTSVLSGGIDDIWHQSTVSASSPTHSWYAGVEPQNNYATGNRINNALISPSVDLTTATPPISLLFTEYYMTEAGWDFCMVDVSTNGGTSWNQLRGGYGTAPNGDSEGWQIATLDLSPYVGFSVNIRFRFDTGDTLFNEFPGWFVDDFVIFDQGGTITGKTFFDVNNNGVKDIGERGIKEWLVTGDGPITLTAVTNYRGRYTLTLPLGTYNVTEQPLSPWVQTMPDTGDYDITLTTESSYRDSIHFGNYRNASFINGIKYHDFDRNANFGPGDTLLPNWKIVLYDTLWNELDFDRTDSIGEYSLYIFEPGTYIVQEDDKHGWVSTGTDAYLVTVPDLSSVIDDRDFSNYYSEFVNSILGQKFNDLNQNGVKDDHEPGLPGFVIHLTAPGVGNKYRTTDSTGNYKFLSLPENKTYTVREIHQAGWCQSMPESTYSLTLGSGEFFVDVDFGNHITDPGSISGVKYFDENGNGLRDEGETGLSGFTINLIGDANGGTINLTTVTDDTGGYTFPGLWAGTYTLSEVWRQGWVQTYPPDLGYHHLILECAQNRTGIDFGNIDSTYLASFRTFKPESLALAIDQKGKHNPIKLKADKNTFCLKFINEEPDSAYKLTIKVSNPIVDGSLTSSPHGTFAFPGGKFNIIEVTFDSFIQPGDSVSICGVGRKAKLQTVKRWWWTSLVDVRNPIRFAVTFTENLLRLPMPNAINVVQLVGSGLRVGVGGPHSVVHTSYKNVMKSLVEKGNRMHIGDPRCLDVLSNSKVIKKERKHLSPTAGQNRLFAKMIAFKVNLLASQESITPIGMGGLIYDDGTGATNPLNDLSLYEIAARADSFMSQDTCNPYGGITAELLDAVLDSINGSFSGPIDTISFGNGLKLTPVGDLTTVSFLRYDTAAIERKNQFIPLGQTEIPEQFSLLQNYPNPFNPVTQIEFYLPLESSVSLRIYNILGQEVALLLDREAMDEGPQVVAFNASDLPSGVYFYRLTAESIPDEDEDFGSETFVSVRKMMLVK